jgi:hypothetical protein
MGIPWAVGVRSEGVTVGRARLAVQRASWALLTTATTLGTLNGLYVLLVPAGDQTELTGRSWEQFAAQDPEVASLYAMDLTLLGIIWTAFGLLASILSVVPYRRGDPWAWYALWLVPVTYGAAATRMLIDQYDAGLWVAGYAAVAVVGLLIPTRRVLELRRNDR